MKSLLYIMPIIAGVAMSIQSGVNGQLRAGLQHPILAALISFVGGTLALLLLLLFSKQALPPATVYSGMEWYKYTGGFLGVIVVVFVILSVHEVGASNMFVLIVAGQLLTALLMDHFGLLGLLENPVSAKKIIGMLMVIGGAWLVTKK